ncbi:MAG: 2Fe-2S iron-sulfur cluster-binding protein [Bacteriovoracaceae bacterium]
MLSDYLRYEKCLTGTKVVCAEGDCGACSVLKYYPLNSGVDAEHFVSMNSCISPLSTLHGPHILTVESLQEGEKLHPAQSSIINHHGTQCGFCTPGFAVALAGLCEEKISRGEKEVSEEEGKNALTGNLCRCTGYNSLIEASTQMQFEKEKSLKDRYQTKEIDGNLNEIVKDDLRIETEDYLFYAPNSYEKALKYLDEYEDAKIIAKGTDLGVVHNKRKIKLNHLLSLQLIPKAQRDGLVFHNYFE